MVEAGLEPGLAEHPLGLGGDLPLLVGQAQGIDQDASLRIVAGLVADQQPDAR